MHNEFLKVLEKMELPKAEQPILVAVSGGIDSMVLATLFYAHHVPFAVAHCNYQLRNTESDKDEQLVRNWCAERGIPCFVRRINTRHKTKTDHSSIQVVAREARYAFFDELVKKHHFISTAIAHHANDRVESLLINLLRGTGIRGLQGMPAQRPGIIRPLLGFTKKQVVAYAKSKHVLYRDDATNNHIYYQRNWVRLRVLPMLEQMDAEAFYRLKKFCERVEKALPSYQQQIAKHRLRIETKQQGWDIAAIKASKIPFTLLKELLHTKGFSSEQVFEVMDIMHSDSGAQVCSKTHCVLKDRTQLLLAARNTKEQQPVLSYELLDKTELTTLKTTSSVALIDASFITTNEKKPQNLLAACQAAFTVRKWKRGDRFRPLGMKGWKKLSDFFIDNKLSALEKERVWVLVYNDEIVWVVGMRIDNRFKVKETTKKVLKIRINE